MKPDLYAAVITISIIIMISLYFHRVYLLHLIADDRVRKSNSQSYTMYNVVLRVSDSVQLNYIAIVFPLCSLVALAHWAISLVCVFGSRTYVYVLRGSVLYLYKYAYININSPEILVKLSSHYER